MIGAPRLHPKAPASNVTGQAYLSNAGANIDLLAFPWGSNLVGERNPNSRPQGPVAIRYRKVRRSRGWSIKTSVGSSSSCIGPWNPNPYRAMHARVPAACAVLRSTTESPTIMVSAAATDARSAIPRSPEDPAFAGAGRRRPGRASPKYLVSSTPSRIARVARERLVGQDRERARARPAPASTRACRRRAAYAAAARRRSRETARARRAARREPAALEPRATSIAAPSPTIPPMRLRDAARAALLEHALAESAMSRHESTSVPSRSNAKQSGIRELRV